MPTGREAGERGTGGGRAPKRPPPTPRPTGDRPGRPPPQEPKRPRHRVPPGGAALAASKAAPSHLRPTRASPPPTPPRTHATQAPHHAGRGAATGSGGLARGGGGGKRGARRGGWRGRRHGTESGLGGWCRERQPRAGGGGRTGKQTPGGGGGAAAAWGRRREADPLPAPLLPSPAFSLSRTLATGGAGDLTPARARRTRAGSEGSRETAARPLIR